MYWENKVSPPQEMQDILYKIARNYDAIKTNFVFTIQINKWIITKIVPIYMTYALNQNSLEGFVFHYDNHVIFVRYIYTNSTKWYRVS